MQISRMIFKIFKNFLKFFPNFYAKGTERNGTVPFCVPLILEAFVPASFLLQF